MTPTLALLALAQAAPTQIPLWPGGAPGFESRRNEPEIAKDYYVRNIQNPSITPFLPPPGKSTGAAVVIVPGGGHGRLVYQGEGVAPAKYLNSIGVACFVLKHRLAREEGSPYKVEIHARQDVERAMRLVRSRAAEWGVDPKRVGALGFSAGAETAAFVGYNDLPGDPAAKDPIDRLDARADFFMALYPGPIGFPLVMESDAPPAFMVVASDDEHATKVVYPMILEYQAAKVPLEVHILGSGGHGFNMGAKSPSIAVRTWPERMADWMADRGLLKKQP